jgi:inhibitor of KinA sporulation pathway (predicted exonuclease)
MIRKDKNETIQGLNIVILDIEGSGCIPGSTPYKSGSIVSLGAVDFNTKEEFYEESRVMDGRSYDEYALKINGFSKEQIFDSKKQSVEELLAKFEDFCYSHSSKAIAAWGEYDLKMLEAAYSYYSRKWSLPDSYINLKNISKALVSKNKPGLSNTAIRLGMPPEEYPHIGINGARLAAENLSVILLKKHYYESYQIYKIPAFKEENFDFSKRIKKIDMQGFNGSSQRSPANKSRNI